ncbi:MAG: ATP-binding cassette domain-containing protein [Bdellovibrionaceae bacterium]|nr:ATP-binding cassette domain-containing protein [Bdellovibrio sp.]
MIHFNCISKSFAKKNILTNISFTVPQGSTTALLGLSGSGKTTLLKMICGLQKPDAGSITVDEINLVGINWPDLRKKMGYVIQDGGLFPHLTAYDNIAIVGQEAGLDSEKIQQKIIELAALTQISFELLSRYPREISGGQRQRIGIMRALFLDPSLLLLDEPFGSLDPITRKQLQSDLKKIFKKMHQTVIIVTHDLFEAGYLADQIVLIHQGCIVQKGAFEDLVKNPANDFVKLFVQSQRHDLLAMNEEA